ncbi:hypothetical protein IEC97_20775 [Neobacillus cucumis]|uniref:hypothetical protein n=1 Tax=Neobacillus cucumis TaxID=1740721 RepID=UPI0018DFDC17|nr:hypothetical protein [Neobacillus cucumis]MBI0579799.1 hypothetical protein [Neobacillus cucumis]
MKKKIVIFSSIALASLFIVGQFVHAENPNNMMNGNGTKKIMEAMNSLEGKKMLKACGDIN